MNICGITFRAIREQLDINVLACVLLSLLFNSQLLLVNWIYSVNYGNVRVNELATYSFILSLEKDEVEIMTENYPDILPVPEKVNYEDSTVTYQYSQILSDSDITRLNAFIRYYDHNVQTVETYELTSENEKTVKSFKVLFILIMSVAVISTINVINYVLYKREPEFTCYYKCGANEVTLYLFKLFHVLVLTVLSEILGTILFCVANRFVPFYFGSLLTYTGISFLVVIMVEIIISNLYKDIRHEK